MASDELDLNGVWGYVFERTEQGIEYQIGWTFVASLIAIAIALYFARLHRGDASVNERG